MILKPTKQSDPIRSPRLEKLGAAAGPVPGYTTAHCAATSSLEHDRLTLSFTGQADMLAIEPTREFLVAVHRAAIRLGVAEVVVDFRALSFMNSSCLKSFVTWLNDVRDNQDRAPYHVRFLSNPRNHWQKASLMALSCFAAERVRVES